MDYLKSLAKVLGFGSVAETSVVPKETSVVPKETTTDTDDEMNMQGVKISDSAADKIYQIILEEDNPDLKLRIFVQGGGCSGFQYGFTLDEIPEEDDYKFEKKGVGVLIDAMSMQYLNEAEIDYKSSFESSQFVISNPNVKASCGCGSSFTVD